MTLCKHRLAPPEFPSLSPFITKYSCTFHESGFLTQSCVFSGFWLNFYQTASTMLCHVHSLLIQFSPDNFGPHLSLWGIWEVPKIGNWTTFPKSLRNKFYCMYPHFFRFKHLKTKGWTNYLSFSCMVISFECFSKIFQQASLSRRPHQSWMSHLHNSLPQRTLTNKTGRRWKIKNSSATSVLFRENIISWPFSHCVSDKNCRKHWPAPPSTRWSK